jgi:hypothetical protein
MTDSLERAVESFLDETDAVLREYDRGYVDADAALSRVVAGVEELREELEE